MEAKLIMQTTAYDLSDIRAHVAQTVVMLVRITCKKAVRVGKAHVDP